MRQNIPKDIIGKINRKGWNVYEVNDSVYNSISCGPVQHMEPGKRYVLCPIVLNPADPSEVTTATKYIVLNCERTPSIRYKGTIVQVPRFNFCEDGILINSSEGPIHHDEFLRALDTLKPVVDLN